ncbi:MAG TPA: aminotransferase class V-fold PLP-dependent enzyme, partial [Allosphingosinicella sp.]
MALIPCQRALFDIPEDVAYFDCAKMSPLLRSAVAAGQHGLARKARPWAINAPDFFDESERVRTLFARLIGATADDVAIIPSVSYGLATVAANAVEPGQTIVLLAEDFPSIALTVMDLARRIGARLVTVERPDDGNWTPALIAAIDERTALVCSPHVHWTDGGRIDLVAVGERCRAVGAALALDTTQSLGALPLDLAAVDPDFMVATAYKWLLGPYSIGFLYAAPRRQEGRAIEQSWIARKGSHDFRRLLPYQEAYEKGARRFDMGERSNFALLPAAGAAIEQMLAWGVANISETLGEMTGRIAARLGDRVEAIPARWRGPHFLSVRFRAPLADDVGERLAAANVHVSLRGDRMRITPHLYNDEA